MGTDSGKHERYRSSGNALVAILITLSSGLLLWTTNLLDGSTKDELVLIISADALLALCIIFSLLALFFHYSGYKSEARSNGEAPTTSFATKFFDKADWLVPSALLLFFVGALFSAVLLISSKI